MSTKNFVSYGDAETLFTGVGNKIKNLKYDGFAGQSICYFESNNPNVEIYITGAGTTIESSLGSEDTSKNLYMIRFTADAPATLTGRLFEYDEEYPVATMNPDLPIIYFDGTPFTREIHAGDYIIIKLTGTNPLTGMIVADFDSTSTGLRSDVEAYQKRNNFNLEVPDRKNVLPASIFKDRNTTGTWSGNTYTLNNVSFECQVNSDGYITSIKVNGTASASTNFFISNWYLVSSDFNNHILTGCPSNGGSDKCMLVFALTGSPYTAFYDYGSGVTISGYDSAAGARCYISVANGATLNNEMFYPMIRPATITDPTFAPYIPSVESRIEAAESGISELNSNLSSYIIVRGYSKEASSISALSSYEFDFTPETISGYTPLMALYLSNSQTSGIVPFITCDISLSNGQYTLGVRNTTDTTIGTFFIYYAVVYKIT